MLSCSWPTISVSCYLSGAFDLRSLSIRVQNPDPYPFPPPTVRLDDWSRSQSGFGPRSVSRFPALQVEEFVTNALLPCFVSVDDGDARKRTLRDLKRSIMASM